MKLHLVALPHVRLGTPWTKLCAYSGKCENFCRMLHKEYEILLYAPESDQIPRADVTLIPCISEAERLQTFGPDDPNRLPGWPTDEQFAQFNVTAIQSIMGRLAPDDIILLSAGWSQKAIADAFPNHLRCEPFLGMEGIIGGNVWGAYESHTHMAAMYQRNEVQDIRCFDTVIPPYFDPVDFPELKGKGDYLLFLGRLVFRKGPHIAAQIADACNMPLVVAGAGALESSSTRIWSPGHVEITGKDLIYVGPVGVEQRNKLIARAVAMMVPTTYREPGGNVAIEAMACGTPAICSNFGCFSEYVPENFLFRTLREAVSAVNRAKISTKKDRRLLREYAFDTFSIQVIAEKFKHWFDNIASLKRTGWYDLD